ncbi:MAG: LLM class flavin-dependent oxidoreductase [Actinomycetota bacterium]
MEVGLLTLGDRIDDPLTTHSPTDADRHRIVVEQAVAAEAAGFSAVHLGEHHFSEYVLTSPPVVLAAIAERTTTVRLSNGVALAANLDPVRTAEDYATVDALSGGRLEPCFGRGSIYPDVYTQFGQSPDEATARFAENVRLIDLLWRADEPVDWSGEFRAPLTDVVVHPRPVQRPRPPLWIGGGWSPDTVRLAVEIGAWLMLPTVLGTWEMFRPIVESYVEQWDAAGRDPTDRRIGCCSHVWIGPDGAEARDRWEKRYVRYLTAVDRWVRESHERAGLDAPGRSMGGDYDAMLSSVAICGSPEEVIDRMGVAAETLSLDTQLAMVDLGGAPLDEITDTIEMLGETVIPSVASL